MDELNEANLNALCTIWEQKQNNFRDDIQELLNQSKKLDRQLREAADEPVDPEQAEEQFKLEQLMIHLTVELQRLNDKDNAKKDWQNTLDQIRAKITSMSQSLSEVGLIDLSAMNELCELPDNSQRNYKLLSQALKRCENLRTENLSVLIDHVRTDIKQWCDMTQHPPPALDAKNDCSSNEMLVQLEQKLADLKDYYNTNQEILELYAKHVKLLTRMTALKDQSKDRNRYQNRGGALLREERERNCISNKLPQIEKQLDEMVQAFQHRTGKPFLVHGVEILSRISSNWQNYHLAKEQQMNARKAVLFQDKLPQAAAVGPIRRACSVPFVSRTASETSLKHLKPRAPI
ncbi:GH23324 [Drosophila grimshawi]|uniref:GH23324 n=2 Tax=Drosophila grimshawi TaxID=7222 RepID=B4K008_DROGR|nr:GH23324 [Drosophila grimshawi]